MGLRRNEILSKEGLRSTKQRITIMEHLIKSNTPLSAEEIFLALNKKGISASLSTVYRNLEAMIKRNLVSKTTLMDDECAKFSIISEKHKHYLICLSCTKIINIEECPLRDLENALHQSTDFEVTGHKLEIYGYCPQCKNKEKL